MKYSATQHSPLKRFVASMERTRRQKANLIFWKQTSKSSVGGMPAIAVRKRHTGQKLKLSKIVTPALAKCFFFVCVCLLWPKSSTFELLFLILFLLLLLVLFWCNCRHSAHEGLDVIYQVIQNVL